MGGSRPGRKHGNWSSPAGWLFKCIIHLLWKSTQDHGDKNMGRMFFELVPQEVCQPIVMKKHPELLISDHIVKDRGDKGTRSTQAFEHPDKHPLGRKLLPFAQEIVAQKLKITKEDVDRIVAEAISREEPPRPIEEALVFPEKSIGKEGYLYTLFLKGSANSAIGITGNPDPMKRIKAHCKGDLDGNLGVHRILWCQRCNEVESYLKNKFKDIRIVSDIDDGLEKFELSPQEMSRQAVLYCNRNQIPHFEYIKSS